MRLFFTHLRGKMVSMPTILAHLWLLRCVCRAVRLSRRGMDNLPAKVVGLLGAEEGGEGDGVDIAVGVLVGFVVAAG